MHAAPGSLSDFRLPSDPAQAPDTDRQGPVAPDVPESRQPRPAPEATPAQPEPPPIVIPQVAEPPVQPLTPPVPTPAARTRSAEAAASAQVAGPEQAEDLPAEAAPDAAAPVAAAPSVPLSTPAPVPTKQEGPNAGLFLLLAVIALAALGLALWAWRGRSRVRGIPLAVPQIERPTLNPAAPARDTPPKPAPAAAEAAPSVPAEPIGVELEPIRLSLTLMNAALAYRLAVVNRGPVALTNLSIGADMISAHASLSREEQLSGPLEQSSARQSIERLEPGERRVVEGEFRVPFPRIVPIRQGNAALLLPLARFRVQAEGGQALVRAFVVGQPGSRRGAGLQPFRLDLGPRVYPNLEQRMFA